MEGAARGAPSALWIVVAAAFAGALGESAFRYATRVLPSTSPAYTRPFAEKLAAWRAIGDFLASAR